MNLAFLLRASSNAVKTSQIDVRYWMLDVSKNLKLNALSHGKTGFYQVPTNI